MKHTVLTVEETNRRFKKMEQTNHNLIHEDDDELNKISFRSSCTIPTVHSRRRESHRKQMHVISPSLLELNHAAIT
jgi:hypothetical protein